MKTIFIITGASGYVGCTLCDYLCRKNHEVRVLLRKPNPPYLDPRAVQYPGDVLDPASIDPLFSSEEPAEFIVIHAASIVSVNKKDPEAYETNVAGTSNLIDACKAHNAKRLVYIGSVDALFNPNDKKEIPEPDDFNNECNESDYAKSKRDASQLVLQAAEEGLDAIICMPSCVIGPGDYKNGFVTFMLNLYIRGIPPVGITGGYDFVDVRDVAKGVVIAAFKAPAGSIYTFSGHFISIRDLFDLAAEHLGRSKTKLVVPTKLLYPLLPFVFIAFKLQRKRPPLSAEALRLLQSEARFSRERAKADLGFKPRPFRNTLNDTLDFLAAKKGLAGK